MVHEKNFRKFLSCKSISRTLYDMVVKSRSLTQLLSDRKPLLASYSKITAFDLDEMKDALRILGYDLESPYVKMVLRNRKGNYEIGYTDPHYKADFGTTTYIDKKNGKYFPQHHFLTDQELKRHFTAFARSYGDKSEATIKRVIESTIAASTRLRSKTIVIDIDNHSSTREAKASRELTRSIVAMFRDQVYAYELNTTTGSGHIFLHTKVAWTDAQTKALVDQLKTEYADLLSNVDIHIDMRYQNKKFRLPGSYNYEVFNCNDSPLPTPKALSLAVRRRAAQFAKQPGISIESYLKQVQAWNEVTNEDTVEDLIEIPVATRQVTTAARLDFSTFRITSGNRVGGRRDHWRLAFHAVASGWTSEQFYEASLKYNHNSKDLAGAGAKDLCFKLYERARTYYKPLVTTPRTSSRFQSNSKLLHQLHKSHCRKIARDLVRTEKRGYWKRIKFKTYLALLWEINGWMIFDKKQPRQVVEGNLKLTAHERKEITKGAVFSKQFLLRLKKHYRLPTNVPHFFNKLVQSTTVLRQYYHNERGYSFAAGKKYCRQWLLGTSIDHTAVQGDIANVILFNLKLCIRSISLITHRIRSQSFRALVVDQFQRICSVTMSDVIEPDGS